MNSVYELACEAVSAHFRGGDLAFVVPGLTAMNRHELQWFMRDYDGEGGDKVNNLVWALLEALREANGAPDLYDRMFGDVSLPVAVTPQGEAFARDHQHAVWAAEVVNDALVQDAYRRGQQRAALLAADGIVMSEGANGDVEPGTSDNSGVGGAGADGADAVRTGDGGASDDDAVALPVRFVPSPDDNMPGLRVLELLLNDSSDDSTDDDGTDDDTKPTRPAADDDDSYAQPVWPGGPYIL